MAPLDIWKAEARKLKSKYDGNDRKYLDICKADLYEPVPNVAYVGVPGMTCTTGGGSCSLAVWDKWRFTS